MNKFKEVKPHESSDNWNEAAFGNTQNFKHGIKTYSVQFPFYIKYFLIFVDKRGSLVVT